MGKEKNGFAGMFEEMIDDVLVKMAAQECIDHAKVKVTLDASSDGKKGSVDLHYEGNHCGYIYGAYILIEEAVKESGIDIDFFLKVIKVIEEHSIQKRPDTKEGEEEDHV